MNIFKKSLQLFSQKGAVKEESEEMLQGENLPPLETDSVKCLLEMPYNVVHPSDLLEPLCMAIAMRTGCAVCGSTDDICLYGLYDLKDETFLGSFYALKREDGYYGNIVGSSQILFCPPNAFRFVETEELIVPLQNDGKNLYVMLCRYVREKRQLTAERLEKRDVPMRNTEILRHFDSGTSFGSALSVWEKEFACK